MSYEDSYDLAYIVYNHRSKDENSPSYVETMEIPSQEFIDFINNVMEYLPYDYISDIRIYKYDRWGRKGHDKDVYDRKFFLSKEEVYELVERIKNNENCYEWLLERVHDHDWVIKNREARKKKLEINE